jgi:hypothetical protein
VKLATTILIATALSGGLIRAADQIATNSSALIRPLRPLTDADWKFISAAQSRKPLSALSITNRLSQDDILSICDPISLQHGLTRYLDGMCGFGARLHRDYVGAGSVCRVSFLWDGSPKMTRFSFYGTNSTEAALWHAEMWTALRTKLGAESVKVEVQPLLSPGCQQGKANGLRRGGSSA